MVDVSTHALRGYNGSAASAVIERFPDYKDIGGAFAVLYLTLGDLRVAAFVDHAEMAWAERIAAAVNSPRRPDMQEAA